MVCFLLRILRTILPSTFVAFGFAQVSYAPWSQTITVVLLLNEQSFLQNREVVPKFFVVKSQPSPDLSHPPQLETDEIEDLPSDVQLEGHKLLPVKIAPLDAFCSKRPCTSESLIGFCIIYSVPYILIIRFLVTGFHEGLTKHIGIHSRFAVSLRG